MSDEPDSADNVTRMLWRQTRRNSLGCGTFALLVAVAIILPLYLYTPIWLTIIVALPVGLFTLMMVSASVSNVRKSNLFLYEAENKWRTGKPTKRTATEVLGIWEDLQQRVFNSTMVVHRSFDQFGGDAPPYMFTLNVFNGYNADIDTYRTLVRRLMPVAPPEGAAVTEIETWINGVYNSCHDFRAEHVYKGGDTDFSLDLVQFVGEQMLSDDLTVKISRLLGTI